MTIREDFIKACVDALSMPTESAEIQQSQASMAEKLARGWIEHNSIEFKLFKLGYSAGGIREHEEEPRPQIGEWWFVKVPGRTIMRMRVAEFTRKLVRLEIKQSPSAIRDGLTPISHRYVISEVEFVERDEREPQST